MADLVEQLHDIHHFARQHLKVASNRMKARYEQLAYLANFQEGDSMAAPPYPQVTQAGGVLGGPVHYHHLD
jgi:hypothetical protein